MDSQTLSIIGTIISTPVILRFVEGWLNTKKENHTDSTNRLDRLEQAITSERLKTEATSIKLFDLAVKHEGLRVHFELLQLELKACKDSLNGSDQAVSH